MPQQGIEVIGDDIVKAALETIRANLRELRFGTISRFADKIRDVAKGICQVDTGALRASIKKRPVKIRPDDITVEVKAGDPNIKRGEGNFIKSKKTGELVSVMPTDEYAQHHERYMGYMETAYHWGTANIEREIKNALRFAFRRVF